MQLKDFIAALQEIQNQHSDEEVYVAIEPEEGEISVEKLLISGEPKGVLTTMSTAQSQASDQFSHSNLIKAAEFAKYIHEN